MKKETLQTRTTSTGGFLAYACHLIERLRATHMPVAEKYLWSLNKFISFYGNGDMPFSAITPTLMAEFEGSMKGNVVRNTSSFYMRCLHAMYNRAVDEGVTVPGLNPFLHVYTGVDKTQKRALQPSFIKKIKVCDLSCAPKTAFARDIFMLSFYLRGMSFIDMAYLEKSDIQGGYLSYCRSKTAHPLSIKWLPVMNEIVDRYAPLCWGNYLLPILSCTDFEKSRRQYRVVLRNVTRHLIALGKNLSLPIKLTTYVARHSWATAALASRVPLSVIGRCLGHDSEKMTLIYLASFDSSELDDANDKVLQSLQ